MATFRSTLLLILAVSVAANAQRRGEHKPGGRRHSGVSKPPAALVEQPALPAPTPPPTPSQFPATAPQVSYRDGLLTVVANNSTLGDILKAVQSQTGASIDYPTQIQDRVIASYGPAAATQVLASLLNGSRFDYILLGTPGRPDLLSKAIITSKPAGAATSTASAAPAPARNIPPPPPPDEDTDTAPEDTAVEQPVEQPPPPQPEPQPAQQNQPGQPVAPGQGQPKTPEQLLQELQRLQQQNQQQQQQQQQNQNPEQ